VNGEFILRPGKLSGALPAPPSKSVAHRAVIASALAHGVSILKNLDLSRDVEATLNAVRALGAKAEVSVGPEGRAMAFIEGIVDASDAPDIDCGESGSTLRFMIPVALAVSGGASFACSGRLDKRPIDPYLDVFRRHGIAAGLQGGRYPLGVTGRLHPGAYAVPGGVSSQFVTGLMLALPLLDGDSTIDIDGCFESAGYVDITRDVLKSFGIAVKKERRGARYSIAGNQRYLPRTYELEGDWSQAAFLLLMGMLGGPVAVGFLRKRSKQGDRAIEEIFRGMGGDIRWEGRALVARQSVLHDGDIDVSQCPDLAPAIAAAMAVAKGVSRIRGGSRLRDKESDRIASIACALNALGADVQELPDGMRIAGRPCLRGGSAQSFGDHRIAMMVAAVSPACTGLVTLEGREAVGKSWPAFWEDFKKLGGSCDG
jgi:3-phosphoshikimate 1-carboxyvinyltransferase